MSLSQVATACQRNHVVEAGNPEGRPVLFVHGFGCDQHMWDAVTPAFADFRVILVDLTGMGRSDREQYDRGRHGRLQGHADDMIEVVEELGLKDVVFVGHSVSATIGALACIARPDLFTSLVMVGPNPRYINEGDYVGGFEREEIEGLLEAMDSNYLGWSSQMAPVIAGNPDRPEIAQELANSFCRNDPAIARHFARVTFLTDHRADLPLVPVPTLVLQCSQDVIAPDAVGHFVADALPDSTFVHLAATGHTPNLSDPEETSQAILSFLAP